MNKTRFAFNSPITLIGGGDVSDSDLKAARQLAPSLIAADGGANAAVAAGHLPEAVIGDFDSLSVEARNRIDADRLFKVSEQDSTDFDKALRHIEAPLILGVGFLGARVDHQLAAFSTLLARADKPCVLIGAQELVFLAPPSIALDLTDGDVVSLYPLVRVAGRSTGLHWPIDGLDLSPDGRLGTSNRATGAITLEVAQPGLLMIVPRPHLSVVFRALQSSEARWPVRG